ncbi:MAG: hypothetical protein M0Z75_16470 [Nitrospiraceae bacterium]|nr:hypothetical protein [Nitrospiraceae bacterium]
MENRNKNSTAFATAFLLLAGIAASCALAFPANAYGWLVGSPTWFGDTERIARDRAYERAYSGKNGTQKPQKLPPGYVELAGKIVFPKGNPFPDGQLPDLHIVCRDKSADSAVRAPVVRKDGSFSTTLKSGQTYDLYWMSYLGFLNKFASIHVSRRGPRRRQAVFSYVYEPVKPASDRNNPQPGGSSYQQPGTSPWQRPQTGPAYQPPQAGPAYQAPQAGPAFQAPQAGPAFQAPQAGPAFHAPQAGPAFHAPQAGPAFQAPKVDNSWQPPQDGPGYQPPGSN